MPASAIGPVMKKIAALMRAMQMMRIRIFFFFILSHSLLSIIILAFHEREKNDANDNGSKGKSWGRRWFIG
jgi:hypothetical protein